MKASSVPIVIREAVIIPLLVGPVAVILTPTLRALAVAGAIRRIFVPFVALVNRMVWLVFCLSMMVRVLPLSD